MSFIKIDIDVRGVDRAIAEVEAFTNRKVASIRSTVAKNGHEMRETMRSLVPIDTGKLRESLDVELISGADAFQAKAGSDLMYSIYVEKGTGIYAVEGNGRKTPWVYFYRGNKGPHGFRWTRGMKPQPFMLPAFTKQVPKFTRDIRASLKGV
jgi:HK97 gp10 family phage protein